MDDYDTNQEIVDDFFHSIVGIDDSSRERSHYDDGDYYYLGYYLNKLKRPMPISWFINDKILDELESHWTDEDESNGYSITSVAEYLSNKINF